MSVLVKTNAFWRVPLILLWTAVMATLSVTLSLADSSGYLQNWCARVWSRFILIVSRVTVSVKGLENLQSGRGYLIVSNHLSMFDHWAFMACLPFQVRFAAKQSLFAWPFLGWHLRRSGHVAVDRQHARQTIRAFQKATKMIEKGISFVIYPEGERTRGEGVSPFKRGSLLMARYAGAPIVPVTIIGAHRRLPRGSVLTHPGKMELIIHRPIEPGDYNSDLDLKKITDQIHQTIAGSYRQVED